MRPCSSSAIAFTAVVPMSTPRTRAVTRPKCPPRAPPASSRPGCPGRGSVAHLGAGTGLGDGRVLAIVSLAASRRRHGLESLRARLGLNGCGPFGRRRPHRRCRRGPFSRRRPRRRPLGLSRALHARRRRRRGRGLSRRHHPRRGPSLFTRTRRRSRRRRGRLLSRRIEPGLGAPFLPNPRRRRRRWRLPGVRLGLGSGRPS